MTPPDPAGAPRLDLVEHLHGYEVADPYRWLEDPADPRTVAWSAWQRDLFARERERWAGLDDLTARLTDLVAFDNFTLPRPRGDRIFYGVRRAAGEHPVLCCAEADGSVRELLDPIAVDPSGSTTLEAWSPSPAGDLLAVQLATGGTEEARLQVLEVETGRVVDGPIGRVRRSPVAWLPAGDAFFYVRRLDPHLVPAGERQYHRRVYLHVLDTDPAEDELIFGDGRDKTDYYGVAISPDGRWLTISVAAGTARGSDIWLADLTEDGPIGARLRQVSRAAQGRTVPYIRGGAGPDDEICVYTEDGADFGRIAVTTPNAMGRGRWRDLVPEQPPAVLTDFAVLDGEELDRPRLLVVRHRHAVAEMTVYDLTTGEELGPVPLPGQGWVPHVVDRAAGGSEAWFVYTDFGTPTTVYRYDARTGEVEPWGKASMPAVTPFVTRQITYEAADGTEVRMFILSPSGQADRPRPTILTGYGGFGVSTAPDYQPLHLAWVEAGGVFAVAHIRGGGEEGETWHRAGIRDLKHRSFDDFAAAADYLVAEGWTTTAQLGVYGVSNGGLLTGAALTRFPEKFAAAVTSASLLDMVRYERFGLGPSWRTEFGTAADPEQLGWLLSYSPYHRVREGVAYPAVLLTVFDGDSRVDPMHGRKMCAALQHASASGKPVLLRTEGDVGHHQRAVSRGVGVVADILAFFATQLGLPDLCRQAEEE
jgi:prolyl oligopeptidase